MFKSSRKFVIFNELFSAVNNINATQMTEICDMKMIIGKVPLRSLIPNLEQLLLECSFPLFHLSVAPSLSLKNLSS